MSFWNSPKDLGRISHHLQLASQCHDCAKNWIPKLVQRENLQKWLNLGPESRDFHGFPINFPSIFPSPSIHQSEEIIGAMMEHPPVAGAAGSTLPQGREPSDVQAPREPRFQGMSIPGYNMKLAADGKTSWGRYGKMNHLCFAMWPCFH